MRGLQRHFAAPDQAEVLSTQSCMVLSDVAPLLGQASKNLASALRIGTSHRIGQTRQPQSPEFTRRSTATTIGFLNCQDKSQSLARRSSVRPRLDASTPRGAYRLYRIVADGIEKRQAGDLRRRPCAARRRFPRRFAAEGGRVSRSVSAGRGKGGRVAGPDRRKNRRRAVARRRNQNAVIPALN